jgi:hypothetical protein
MDPERPGPARPRELTWFLALAIVGVVGAALVALFMYWIAPAMFGG